MRGIYFKEYSLQLIFILIVLLGVANAILPIFEEWEKDTKTNDEKRWNIRIIIQCFVQICTIVLVVAGTFYLIDVYEIVPLIWLSVIVACVGLGLAFCFALIEFIQYIFITPYNFAMSKDMKNIFLMAGLFFWAISKFLIEENFINWYKNFAMKQHLSRAFWDLFKVLELFFWYFGNVFLIFTLSILFLQNTIILSKKFFYKKERRQITKKKDSKEQVHCFIKTESVWNRIWKEKRKKEVLLLMVSLIITCFIDTVECFIITVLDLLQKMIVIVVRIPYYLCKKMKVFFSKLLKKDQSSVIILGSRVSLIVSLMIVYVIDSYQYILSNEGSKVYEFICSVVLIPFLAKQYGKLKLTK